MTVAPSHSRAATRMKLLQVGHLHRALGNRLSGAEQCGQIASLDPNAGKRGVANALIAGMWLMQVGGEANAGEHDAATRLLGSGRGALDWAWLAQSGRQFQDSCTSEFSSGNNQSSGRPVVILLGYALARRWPRRF